MLLNKIVQKPRPPTILKGTGKKVECVFQKLILCARYNSKLFNMYMCYYFNLHFIDKEKKAQRG